MKISTLSRRPRRGFTSLIAAVLVAGILAFGAAPANASTIDLDYAVNGTTHVASTGSNITLGPATMHAQIEGLGSFVGDMQLPGARTEFKLLGFIPVTADVHFESVGPTTGNLVQVDRMLQLQSTTQYYVRLSNIKAGILPLFAGQNCRTSQPVHIEANTPAGERFIPALGGRLVGEYSIGSFQNCGLNTWLINQIIPGGGNTVELQLSDPQPGS